MAMNDSVMKKQIIPVIIGIVTAVIIITGGSFVLIHHHDNGRIGKSVTDMETISLRLSGMRVIEEYELTAHGTRTEISYYTVSFTNGGEEKTLRKRTACDTQTVIDALNSFEFVKWNGFSGKHPRGVLDGTMFTLTATINGGQKLNASGSQNFPKHFHEFEQWLYEVLKDGEEIG